MTTADFDYNLAVFCDFENVALGVRDAKIPKFDMQLVLERLLLKGSIVVRKAYCDWDRYKTFKPAMHEAAFELIEIPHTRQSGKNSADIRMVVDALDLCYTKEHIDTFVIVSGDSDFSPLVSKLRENAKTVIGVGVKNSTSELLMNSCDEFIFYDDLVRASGSAKAQRKRPAAKKVAAGKKQGKKSAPAKKAGRAESAEKEPDRRDEAIDLLLETADALFVERGDRGWGSMIKQTLKRRRPGFNESYFGFRSFSDLLEEAEERGLLDLEMDERSGGYVIRAVHRGD
ncbi:MAG TPA: NYN domain-containing protein [Kiloniellaceae bacterium]|nr:NYN domain-containing protein [Kiloniellaceae bacterium]